MHNSLCLDPVWSKNKTLNIIYTNNPKCKHLVCLVSTHLDGFGILVDARFKLYVSHGVTE